MSDDARISRVIQNLMFRGEVSRVTDDNDVQGVQGTGVDGWPDESEHVQPYGFRSKAKTGAQMLFLRLGAVGALLSFVFDGRYRVTLDDGEVAIFDDQGQKVHLKRAGIEVSVPTGKTIKILGDDITIANGTGTLDTLVKWPALLSYLQGLTLAVTGTADLITGAVAGTTTPPASVPDMSTTKTKAT